MRRFALLAASGALVLGLAAQPVSAREPSPTIVAAALSVNARTGEFDHLIAAVVRAGLVEVLDGNRQLTVFAPTPLTPSEMNSKGFLVPSVHDGAAYVNDARIVAADVDASNGVIHVIDRVLLPQG